MATGDVKNNLRKLMKELKQLNYPIGELNLKGLSLGTPASFLPILHYVFLDFSVNLTEFFAKEYELYGKTDLRFMETVYKILRDVFQYKPPLTREQFLTIGFAERKIIQVCEILQKCREKYKQLNPKNTKLDKKQASKVKSMFPGVEKQDNVAKQKVLQEIQSCPASSNNGGRTIARQQKTESKEPPEKNNSKNSGKSILKVRKDEEKENKNGFDWLSDARHENMNERRDQTLQPLNRLKSGIKNVRWEEERNGSVTMSKSGFGSLNAGVTYDVSRQPLSTTITLPLPPRIIPAPVSITSAPEPSPDLMLTPMTKSGHQAIPLSHSKDKPSMSTVSSPGGGNEITDVSLIDLTESTSVAQPKIVRHTVTEQPPLIPSHMPSTIKENEIKSLHALVDEMQEKLDIVLSQNNEMSARIVLLENKVKLLEESRCANGNSGGKMDKIETLSRFSQSGEQQLIMDDSCPQRRVQSANQNSLAKRVKRYDPQPSTSSRRLLLDEFNESQPTYIGESSQVYSQTEETLNNKEKSPTLIEISDDDIEGIHTNESKTSPRNSPLQQLSGQGLEVISPLQTTSDIHLKFSDPTTTATILNVERRLKETRAMLANATRFPQPNAF